MNDFGWATFNWPSLPNVRHKPLDADLMDNHEYCFNFKHGGHMTICVFLEQGGSRRRSESALRRRATKAEARENEKQKKRDMLKNEHASSAVAGNPASSSSANK